MPKADEIQVIVEWTHDTLHALRAVQGTIVAGGECALENRPGLEALIGAVAPSWKTEGIKAASVWPDAVDWHLSTDAEAALHRTAESLNAVAAAALRKPKGPFAYAACNAGDGGPITSGGMGKWILASTSGKALERVSVGVPGFEVDWGGARPAAFAQAGAISAALRGAGTGSVALWDLGADLSHLLLVTANGIEGVAPCAVGLNAVFESVQAALKLKFRGAGARLFFNQGYDFTESGPRISAVVAESLKQALGLLPSPAGPAALACVGLTGKQAWFIRDAAQAAGISPWEPDLGKLAGDLGLGFADDALRASFSPASAGLFEILRSRMRGGDTWLPTWAEGEAPAEEAEPAPVPVEGVEPPAPQVPPPARSRPALAQEGAPPPPPQSQRPAKAAAPPPPANPILSVRPPAPPGAAPPPFSLPAFTPAPEPGAPPPALPPSGPGPQAVLPAGVPPPKRSTTSLPFEAARLKPVATVMAVDQEDQPKSKVGFYVGIVAAAALVFAAIAVALNARMEKTKERYLEQQEALAHHLAEVRLKDAGLIAKAAAEQARKDAEAAALAAQQQQTQAETKPIVPAKKEAATGPTPSGTLVVATAPAGASVSIDGAAPFTTPARQEGIAAGPHRVRVTLAGYQSVELETQVKGAGTTDLGTISLESSLGTLEIASSPSGLEFAVRTAADPAGKPLRAGRTPATLAGIPRGDYAVTFSRPGCRDHIEKVSVGKEATFPVATKYLDGAIELSSDPTGAWVDRDGARIGTTPMVLHDLAPRPVSLEITLPGYDPTPVTCDVPEGQTLKVLAKLLRKDRIFNAGEVKSLPASYESPQPELTPSERKMDAEVLISFVVQRDGTVVDVEVEKATDDDIGRRCAAAVAKWKFRPGTAPDDRTVDVRIEMPFKFSAGNS